MSNHRNRIQLVPAEHWRSVARDDEAVVWITETSIADLARFEPSARFIELMPSVHAEAVLRATDYASFVVVDKRGHVANVECRPRARERLYVSQQDAKIEVASGLRHVSRRQATLSRRFVAIWLANAIGCTGLDHFLGCSPFEGHHLITQGVSARVDLQTAKISTSFIEREPDFSPPGQSLRSAIEDCRNALRSSILTATSEADVVVSECSGGIDSSLVTIIAYDTLANRFRGGIFAEQPYHEFRAERAFAESVAEKRGFALQRSSPHLAMCWAALCDDRMPVDCKEPSSLMPFWGQVLMGYDGVRDYQRPTILTGLGGDRLFMAREPPAFVPERPEWLSPSLWDEVRTELITVMNWLSDPNRNASGHGFVNPWFQDKLDDLHSGALYYSPLSSRCVISAFNALRHVIYMDDVVEKAVSRRIQKPLAHAVFSDYLPESLWIRRGKLDFDGLFYRFWLNSGERLVSVVERMQPHLASVGLTPKVLTRHVRDMADGKHSADTLLNSIVTYSFWLDQFLATSR